LHKRQLAIVVKEQDYMKRLADYVRNSSFGEQWQIIAFSSAAACIRYAEEGYRLDCIAGQPELLADLREHALIRTIPRAALVMTLRQSGEEVELRQYQPLPDLLQQLAELHARSRSPAAAAVHLSDNDGGSKAIAVYSAAGGEGKTALALHLAQAAGARGRKVFYLNLELWNTSEDWLGAAAKAADSAAAGLSELLYKLKTEQEQATGWIMEHRRSHPLLKSDYLAPATNVEDRMTLGAEDASALIAAIKRCGLYDLIVIDMDDGLGELEAGIFDSVGQVLWVVNEALGGESKRRLKLQYGRQRWGERFERMARKFLYVWNRASGASGTTAKEYRWAAVRLPEVAEWRGMDRPLLLSSPAYRAAVDKLFYHLFGEGGT
jgi:Mrp family chromosome partitioning ATPase